MPVRVEVVTPETIELGPSVTGYRVHFAAGPVRGQAWFASAAGEHPPPPGDYSVETGLQEVRGLRVVARSAGGERGITPLPTPGDYRVRGSVEVVLGEGNGGPATGAYVRAGDWSFMIDSGDCTAGDLNILGELAEGDEVEFDAVGLSLWDENL